MARRSQILSATLSRLPYGLAPGRLLLLRLLLVVFLLVLALFLD
jgi:hypothetical protein